MKVSYLAHGFAWSSDYVAHLNERSDAMRLAGWATLTNSTGTVFEQAEVQLVARQAQHPRGRGGRQRGGAVYRGRTSESDVDARAGLINEEAVDEVALLRDCFATDAAAADPPPRGARCR